MSTISNWIPFIRKVYLFSTFTEQQLNLLAKKMRHISYPKDAVVFKELEPGESLYILLSGSVRIVKTEYDSKSKSTHERIVSHLTRGDVMGEISLLTGNLHTKSAIVESSTDLLVLDKKDFDNILKKYPACAVHLSRLLSSRLAIMDHDSEAKSPSGKLFSFMAALPDRDQIIFAVNFGISLVEQTRKKVLLITVNDSVTEMTQSMKLKAPKISPTLISQGTFEEIRKFHQIIETHPSGLEVLPLSKKDFFTQLGDQIFPMFTMVKDHYDYCILVLPTMVNDITNILFQESERCATITGPQSSSPDLEEMRRLYLNFETQNKIEKIWLSLGPEFLPWDFTPTFKLPWKMEWGRQLTIQGSPYIPIEDKYSQRMLDRLARSYGGLLIGLAMGSGAAFGYSLIGILKVLEREGIYPDVISGTSMGALIGAFYAAGKTPAELEVIAKTITRKKLWEMVDFAIPPRSGIIKGNGVLNFLRSHLGDKTFQDLYTPFCCVATDIQTGKEIDMDQGNVAEAVRASISLPFFFQPSYLDGRFLVDGGLVNPVPTSIIMAQGANILLSANLTSRTSERKVPRVMGWRKKLFHVLRGPSIPEIFMKTIYTMQYEISRARSVMADVVMQINANDLLWWDLDRASEIIKIGEVVAEENLPKIKSFLPFFANSCQVKIAHRK